MSQTAPDGFAPEPIQHLSAKAVSALVVRERVDWLDMVSIKESHDVTWRDGSLILNFLSSWEVYS